jgi:hypothetical protein
MNELKLFVYKILHKKPGRRFLFSYSRINRYIRHNLLLKILFSLFGIIFLMLGFLMLFLPGPGLLFMLLGIVMLCVSSRQIAYYVDRLEHNINLYFK